jgi:hypothetical protein
MSYKVVRKMWKALIIIISDALRVFGYDHVFNHDVSVV